MNTEIIKGIAKAIVTIGAATLAGLLVYPQAEKVVDKAVPPVFTSLDEE